jgi:DNA polymerase
MTYVFVDFETFSLLDLTEVGLDRYARHSSTGVSLLGWAVGQEEIQAWLPHQTPFPSRLLELIRDSSVLIIAWNSQFERAIFKHVLKIDIPLERFRDPIILAHNISLPGKLESVARILKMKEQKDERGDELKKMFCQPVSMGGDVTLFGISPPLFRDHNSHPREFQEYISYCQQDVRAMRDLWYRLAKIPFPEIEWKGWILDQKINEFGMPGNRQRAEKMLRIAERFITEQRTILKAKTGLENPNSDQQMKEWLMSRGYPWNSLNAKYVQAELDNPTSTLTAEAREVLLIRKDARKSSYKKLEKFLAVLSDDDRLRYQFRYMGAARTGRWASGGGEDGGEVQVQNMSRGEKAVKKKLQRALELVDAEDYDGILREFTNVPDKKKAVTPVSLVITLLRSLFEAKPGNKLVVADKNAIENRMLGWASGCKAILDVFTKSKEEGGDPYLAFGTKLYNKSYAEMWASYIAGNEDERQNAKPAVLGAGYGLGGGEMYKNENGDMVRGGLWGYAKNVCGTDMPKELAHKAVKIFRESYPEVVQFWTDLEEGFKQVLKRGGKVRVGEVAWDKAKREWVEHPTKGKQCVIEFQRLAIEGSGWMMRMVLPSGRALHYLNATIDEEKRTSQRTGQPYTAEVIHFDGIEHSTTQGEGGQTAKKTHKWGRVKTYGAKLVENAIQALSRDDLLHSMFLADEMGFSIWGIFHDELACEVADDPFGLTVTDLNWCLTQVPEWAPGMLLGSEGWDGRVYHK